MFEFSKVELKPLSWQVLTALSQHEAPCKAEVIAEELGLITRQVDAVVTRSLVRHGFCIRVAKLTRLLKKEYNELAITDRGRQYVQWRLQTKDKAKKVINNDNEVTQ